jgi:hypothetical protein
VLLVGVRGAACEIAKNIVLAGLKRVVLVDPTRPKAVDLAANFLLDLDASSVWRVHDLLYACIASCTDWLCSGWM